MVSQGVRDVLSLLFPSIHTSSPSCTHSERKQNIVVVGGGVIGSMLTRRLSAQIDPSKHNLILIESRPYAIWLIAGCRLTVTEEGHLEERCLVPFDNIFLNGNGSVKRGRVVAIGVTKKDTEKKDSASRSGNEVVLDDGERVPFDALILATGSTHSGPIAFPDDSEKCIDHIQNWRNKFKDAERICLVGGGGVAVELAGELKDLYPNKQVTIVHGQSLLLKAGQFPDKFRKHVGEQLTSRGIELVLGEYVATFPDSGPGEVVLRSGVKISADLVVPTYGPQPHTYFISSSLGPETVSPTGYVRIKPTLQLESYPSIFAVGDIIDFPEGKRATKGAGHISVVTSNLMSYLDDPSLPLKKEYKGSLEAIVLTNGKNGGMGYIPVLWGIIVGNWVIRRLISRDLKVEIFRRMLGM